MAAPMLAATVAKLCEAADPQRRLSDQIAPLDGPCQPHTYFRANPDPRS